MKSTHRGTNQIAVRSYNERLLLQLVRSRGELTKAEATRVSMLSANATSVIFRKLESDGLVIRGNRVLGKRGQPSTPMKINPDAHLYVSLKIGRRSVEIGVVDFAGEIRSQRKETFQYPTPNGVLGFVKNTLNLVLKEAKIQSDDVTAMAVAMPFELWSWAEDFNAPRAELEQWRELDIKQELSSLVPWSISVENDGTAACRAEQVFGSHNNKQDWIYFFVGTFIGGGVVLNGSVFPGRRGNAGGFGPLRVPDIEGGERLVDHASLIVLESALLKEGMDPSAIYLEDANWEDLRHHWDSWLKRAGKSLAHAIVSSLSILDFDSVVIDGSIPSSIKELLVSEVIHQLNEIDMQGVHFPVVEAGQIGRNARLIGAAGTLISRDYLLDQNTIMRT
ncbi:putative Transcriptional regulator, ROK family [Vibrio nigripulchritudo MADA3029]|uniref:ROK family protein n=1 Tax=Vibrio nigripulchritudo TaxID=28173 RepID=UPI0003B2362F|nr:ROK family protein [Vibrio nigripulchritudo]CCN47703.1 putative Transcriptional regulator, ROK family [Vibrio nigripulchritudo MADA3020]CCN56084.1 putative Transcriptional regulator, ROK family [Vibrio nigripulchritudo MADA3021]CCN58880.1 putative Transcriptional regulator, ROK family [Vibrio nigripulchritudo MADA3029]